MTAEPTAALAGKPVPAAENGRTSTADVASGATLASADLRGADLVDVVARGADFSGAALEQARFGQADLGGSNFTQTEAGEADFSDAMLEDARFTRARLRYANLRGAALDGADFENADLWGACLAEIDADDACFRQSRCDEVDFTKSNLSGADFAGASLKKAKLSGARLRGVKFEGATLDGSDLDDADLSNASLPRVNLSTCSLHHARFAGAWLENTRMRSSQLGGAVGEEITQDYDKAHEAYVALEQNFRTLGNGDDASWAFRRGRRMRKLKSRAAVLRAWHSGHYRVAGVEGLSWVSDMFVEWLCDYGESLGRVIRAFFVTLLGFALLYGLTGSLTRLESTGAQQIRRVTRNVADLLVYSFLNMLSTSAPDIGLRPVDPLYYLLSSLQGAIGIVLIGLFGYVLGNRMHK